MDARILADLLRGKLVPSVHIVRRESRQIKEVLRQRCFFVRQRTMLRNRIHRLLGAQHEVKLPQCSDLFGRKGLNFLEKLELPAPARLLLTQQLALLKELAMRIGEDEKALEGLLQESPALNYVRSLPGMGPILAAVVVSEIDGIERFPSAQKLCGYAGLCPSTHSSGGKTFQANYYDIATNGSARAFVEAAGNQKVSITPISVRPMRLRTCLNRNALRLSESRNVLNDPGASCAMCPVPVYTC